MEMEHLNPLLLCILLSLCHLTLHFMFKHYRIRGIQILQGKYVPGVWIVYRDSLVGVKFFQRESKFCKKIRGGPSTMTSDGLVLGVESHSHYAIDE